MDVKVVISCNEHAGYSKTAIFIEAPFRNIDQMFATLALPDIQIPFHSVRLLLSR